MVRTRNETLWVWIDDPAFGPLQRIGTLSRGDRGSIRFAYDPEWLRHSQSFPLDPELDLYPGDFFPTNSNFGVFMDSCPDRWGQILMKRREVVDAKDEGRPPITLGPWEFLLGVQDCTRMGALRFTPPDSTTFLADEALSAPPVTRLAELEKIAFELSRSKHEDLDKMRQWLKVLVAPGSSLGGARPKANIVGKDGCLWIAKFPSSEDDYDVALWEKVLHDMALNCDISVPESRIVNIGARYHTFMVKRFDRTADKRVFFASAMTMLGRVDTDEASYLEIAEFLATYGDPNQIEQDLKELFTRIVFNVATANRDDHLRNHGFIRRPSGWRLSPAFDLNPSFKKYEHALSPDLVDHRPDLDTVLETAVYYRLSNDQAKKVIDDVCRVVSGWRAMARKTGLSSMDCLAAEHLFLH